MHIAYLVLDIGAMSIGIMIVGAVCAMCCPCDGGTRGARRHEEDVVINNRFNDAPCEELVIKLVGGDSEAPEGGAVIAKEVV